MPRVARRCAGDFDDAGETFDGERREEGVDVFGLDDEEAVGLAPVGGDLGEEFVGGDAGGGGEVELVANGVADGAGDFGGGGGPHLFSVTSR